MQLTLRGCSCLSCTNQADFLPQNSQNSQNLLAVISSHRFHKSAQNLLTVISSHRIHRIHRTFSLRFSPTEFTEFTEPSRCDFLPQNSQNSQNLLAVIFSHRIHRIHRIHRTFLLRFSPTDFTDLHRTFL